jgi:hypothetical protein
MAMKGEAHSGPDLNAGVIIVPSAGSRCLEGHSAAGHARSPSPTCWTDRCSINYQQAASSITQIILVFLYPIDIIFRLLSEVHDFENRGDFRYAPQRLR